MYEARAEIDILDSLLRPLADQVEVKPPHWLHTPDNDDGENWCCECGTHKIKNLRKKARKNRDEYFLDGGWRTEEESLISCISCGVQLDVSLLPYGVSNELEIIKQWGFYEPTTYTAFVIVEILNSVSCQMDPDDEQKEAIELAKKFTSSLILNNSN